MADLVLALCFSLLLLCGLEAPRVRILDLFLSCIRLSRAVSMAFKVSLLIGILEPRMGVSGKMVGVRSRAGCGVKILTVDVGGFLASLHHPPRSLVFSGEGEESLLDGHSQGSYGSLLLPVPLQVLSRCQHWQEPPLTYIVCLWASRLLAALSLS